MNGFKNWAGLLIIGQVFLTGCEQSSTQSNVSQTESPSIVDASPDPDLPLDWEADGSREWRHIVVHHTASPEGSVESIHELHRQRKDKDGNPWMGIGYHFVIGNGRGMNDGEIETTFRWREQLHGAHAGNFEYNQHGIGIALIGNFEESPPTPAQVESAQHLIDYLTHEHNIPTERILGHGDVNATACPGKLLSMTELVSGIKTASEQGITESLAK